MKKSQLELLEERVQKIEERNRRVEGDKAWETSSTRTMFIASCTFFFIYVFMRAIEDEHPFLNAVVASFGYLISSTTYTFLKLKWLRRHRKSQSER